MIKFKHTFIFEVLFDDELFAISLTADEEFDHGERMANWTTIKDLVEDDAHEKRKLIFSPGVSQGPGQSYKAAS